MESIDGKVALIFGAGSIEPGALSNGKAAAATYARAGARVAVVDIDPTAAEETAAFVRNEGHDVLVLTADVSKADQVEAAVSATLMHFGRVDILHNNVGLLEFASVADTTEEQWDRVMAINVKGMFLACQAVLPHMVERGSGAIINISALASVRYLGPAVTYMTSKAAVNGLTHAIAMEYAALGIRCNAVLPGFIDTPVGLSVHTRGDPETAEARKAYRNSKLPGGRAGQPWDIANAALFLASGAGGYINGVLLPVDNGVMRLSPTAI